MTKNILPHRDIGFNVQVLHRLSSIKHIANTRKIAMFCQGRTMLYCLYQPAQFHYNRSMYLCGSKKCHVVKYSS